MIIRNILFVVFFFLLQYSFGDPLSLYIPKDSTVVLTVNSESFVGIRANLFSKIHLRLDHSVYYLRLDRQLYIVSAGWEQKLKSFSVGVFTGFDGQYANGIYSYWVVAHGKFSTIFDVKVITQIALGYDNAGWYVLPVVSISRNIAGFIDGIVEFVPMYSYHRNQEIVNAGLRCSIKNLSASVYGKGIVPFKKENGLPSIQVNAEYAF
jgi:hypothetical protein